MTKLEILKQKVETLYQAKDPNADVWTEWAYVNHVLVVANYAEKLSEKHDANLEFAVSGALLHDIADVVMDRDLPRHEEKSVDIARELLMTSGFSEEETHTILHEIIEPHSCAEIMPETLEGKIVATADAVAHFETDFYPYFCWQHYGPDEDYTKFKTWVLRKMEKDFTNKIFFEEVKNEIMPKYEALKLVFGQ